MSSKGKPSVAIDNTPRSIARQLNIQTLAGFLTWHGLIDAAALEYWRRRPEQSRPALVEARLRRQRQQTPVEVYIRRAGAA